MTPNPSIERDAKSYGSWSPLMSNVRPKKGKEPRDDYHHYRL